MGGATLTLVRADAQTRNRDRFLLLSLAAWLLYTRLYAQFALGHAVLPTCPFLLLTGHPCPLCGGTRSFASMWQADIGKAARFHPLGPVLFVGSVVAALLLGFGLARGRSWRLQLSPVGLRTAIGLALAAFTVSWTLKLLWLGN